jgi:hypothetical protein
MLMAPLAAMSDVMHLHGDEVAVSDYEGHPSVKKPEESLTKAAMRRSKPMALPNNTVGCAMENPEQRRRATGES